VVAEQQQRDFNRPQSGAHVHCQFVTYTLF